MSQSATLPGMLWRWWPLLLGNVLEWYEFAVFGYLAQQMKANFFHASTSGVWLGFAVTFLMRPVGGVAFGCLADRIGRRSAVLCSMCGMLVATFGQGLLPGRVSCGDTGGDIGLVLLLALRVLQGLCTGGEQGPLMTYLAESAPPGMQAVSTVLFLFTAMAAFMLSSSLVALLLVVLGHERMLMWGWRVPFLLTLAPGLLTLWGRSKLPETPEFVQLKGQQQKQVQISKAFAASRPVEGNAGLASVESSEDGDGVPARALDEAAMSAHPSLVDLCREHGCAVFVGFGATVGCSGAFYMCFWCASYIVKQGVNQATALLVSSSMMAVVALVGALAAWLTDSVLASNPLPLTTAGAMCIAVAGTPIFAGLGAHPGNVWVAVLCLSLAYGAVCGVALSQAYLFCLELFPTRVRALGFGLTFNLAMSYVGGTAALAGEALAGVSPLAPGLYVSALGLLSAAILFAAKCLRAAGHLPRYRPCAHLADARELKETVAAAAAAAAAAGVGV